MREVLRRKRFATSLCAGPHRIEWAVQPAVRRPPVKSGCLCGSPELHCAQFVPCSDPREHAV